MGERFRQPEEIKEQGGIIAEAGAGQFLKEKFRTDVEQTEKAGDNDAHHIDYFVPLKNGEIFCVDITGAKGKPRQNKTEQQKVMPYVYRYENGEAVGDEVPRFTIDVNLGFWSMLTHKMEEQKASGKDASICGLLSEKEQRDQWRSILGQILTQIKMLSKDSTYKEKILAVREAILEEAKEVFSKKELEMLAA